MCSLDGDKGYMRHIYMMHMYIHIHQCDALFTSVVLFVNLNNSLIKKS